MGVAVGDLRARLADGPGAGPRGAGKLRTRGPERVAPSAAARVPSPSWSPVITATDLELRAGSRILLSDATLRVQPGDRIGLVGRNGAGKTTSMRVLAGEGEPYGGTVAANGPVGYLPQDPREGDLTVTAKDRVLSARGLDQLLREMEKAQARMSELVDGAQPGRSASTGASRSGSPRSAGTPRRATPLGSARTSGCRTACSTQTIQTLSGGQRRRVELARILFAASDGGGGGAPSATTLLLDEPTNHLDADSITWLRSFLSAHEGGLVVISHDTELLAAVVNKVWFLDATRGEVDVYNMDWRRYQEARATDEKRRRRERANAEKKARRCTCRRRRWARRRPRPWRRRTWRAARTSCWPDWSPSAATTRSRGSGSRTPPRAGARRSPRRACRRPTGRWRCSPGWTWPSTRARRSSSWA